MPTPRNGKEFAEALRRGGPDRRGTGKIIRRMLEGKGEAGDMDKLEDAADGEPVDDAPEALTPEQIQELKSAIGRVLKSLDRGTMPRASDLGALHNAAQVLGDMGTDDDDLGDVDDDDDDDDDLSPADKQAVEGIRRGQREIRRDLSEGRRELKKVKRLVEDRKRARGR